MPIINDPDKFIQDETDPASLGVQPDFDMGNGAEPMPGTLTPDEAPMPTDTPPLEQEPDIGQNPFEDMEPSADPENTGYGLSEEKLDDIKQNVLKEIAAADNYYEEEIEPAVIKRHKIFDSDSSYYETKYPKLSKISDVTASDFHDTVEWAIPSLIKVFFGGEDICKLEGANSEQDDKAAKTHEELIKYQLERCNEGFLVFYDWIKNALVDNIGFIKCYWEREETIEQKHIMVTEEELMLMQANPKINVLAVAKLGPGAISVDYEETTQITKNQPKLEVIPPSEFRFSPDAKNLEDIDFVAHRKIVTLDYLRRREREGIFQNIDKVVDEEGEGGAVSRTMYETDMNPMAYNKVADVETEDAKKEYLLYECYVKTDVNDDNILEDIIITIVGNTVVRLEENTMGRHPFFAISPIRDPLRLFPKRGIADLVGELQDLNTALLKQIISNVAINNDKQAFVNIDVLVDPNEFIDGRKAVRVNGDPSQAVKWSPIEPLPPSIFTFLENLQAMKETRTGITRYNQGLDANSLNKTATGITQIMNASNQRLELIARIFAETGVKQLFRHMIKMNQMFITEETFIRVTDQRKPISPDDLAGTIDITVNVGVAAGTKQQQLQNMQLLLQMYPQALQIGIADPSHIAYAFGRIIESMGYKNTSDFVFTPDILKMAEAQGVTPQVMMMMMQQQQTGQTPPALQQYQDNAMRNKLAEVAQTRGLTGSAAQSNQEQQLAQAMAGAGQGGPPQEQVSQGPQNDLTTQQFAQRNAPQPAALSADRRIPAQGG